jgi:hypothetical protein
MPKKRKIEIHGYVARMKESSTRNGVAMLNLSIPIAAWSSNERDGYKKAYSGTGYEATSWHNITLFGKKANDAKIWLHKGSFVVCEVAPFGIAENGTMTPKIWQGKGSYDWSCLNIRQEANTHTDEPYLDDEPDYTKKEEQEPPPGFEEEDEIPF